MSFDIRSGLLNHHLMNIKLIITTIGESIIIAENNYNIYNFVTIHIIN